MYIAELHGKLTRDQENKEDILTSNVFSFFKYTPRNIFLFSLIRSLGLDISVEDAEKAKFHFWPRYEDHTEPDLVIIIGKYYLLIEAKYFSGFGEETEDVKHQLMREIEGGVLEAHNLGKEFRIIAVTAHYYFKPSLFKDVPEIYLDKLIWINWQKIAFLIKQLLELNEQLAPEVVDFAADLYALLIKKRLRSFEGIHTFQGSHRKIRWADKVFFQAETAQYRGDFLGFVLSLSTLPKQNKPIFDPIFFSASRFYFQTSLPTKPMTPTGDLNIFFSRSPK